MAEARGAGVTEPYRPNIFAQPVGKESVVAVVGAGAVPAGPWSYVTGIPNPALIWWGLLPNTCRWPLGPLEPWSHWWAWPTGETSRWMTSK